MSLTVLPIVSAIGFGIIGVMPCLTAHVLFIIIRRIVSRHSSSQHREVLFTVVSREEKYTAKNCIDTVVSRRGDAITG